MLATRGRRRTSGVRSIETTALRRNFQFRDLSHRLRQRLFRRRPPCGGRLLAATETLERTGNPCGDAKYRAVEPRCQAISKNSRKVHQRRAFRVCSRCTANCAGSAIGAVVSQHPRDGLRIGLVLRLEDPRPKASLPCRPAGSGRLLQHDRPRVGPLVHEMDRAARLLLARFQRAPLGRRDPETSAGGPDGC